MLQGNELRILIIDDNPAIHQDFIKILTTQRPSPSKDMEEVEAILFNRKIDNKTEIDRNVLPNFQIDTAMQGQEGVDRIKKGIEENWAYSLAFVDMRMPPGWDGIMTIQRIWKIDPTIQVVICTAYSDYTWEETVQKLGSTDNLLILKKPFDNTVVRQLAFALTKKWQLSKENKKNTAFLEQRIQERTNAVETALSEAQTTLEASSDGMLITNDNKIVNFNRIFINLWKMPESILAKKNVSPVMEYILSKLQNSYEFNNRLNNFKKNKNLVSLDLLKVDDNQVFECYSEPNKLKNKIIGRVFSFRNITKRILLERKLEHQATHDNLTDLPNRVLLNDRINFLIENFSRTNNIFSILFIDLDRFKLVNDSLSHLAGDELLTQVAKRLKSYIRKSDIVTRVGGDEFVIVLPGLKATHDIINFSNKILGKLRESYNIFGREISSRASVGISLYPQDGDNFDALLQSADLAMYRAKELGGDQCQFYSPILSERSLKRLEMETELHLGLEREEFVLHYQPEFDADSGELVAVEALIRWNHPQKGLIYPLDFIPIAEETGLIVPLGEWVLRTACKQNKLWQEAGFPKIRMSINISTAQFLQDNFVEKICKILDEVDLETKYLEIEVTENAIINCNQARKTIQNISKMGISIALDDFGTGSSSISHLRNIPINQLKLDKSFVQNISKSHNDEVLIRAILQMAENLNLTVVAEGVEKKSQVDFLRKINHINIQGYYFSKPLTGKDFEEFMIKYQSNNNSNSNNSKE